MDSMTTCLVLGFTLARIIDWVRTVPPNLASLSEPSRSTVKGCPGAASAVGTADADARGAADALAPGVGVGRSRMIVCPVSWKAVTIAGMKYATVPMAPDSTKPSAMTNPSRKRLRRT